MATVNNKLIYILHSSFYGDRQIFPSGESSIKLSCEIHDDIDDPLHDYIYKLTGSIVIFGDDFDWVKTIEDDVDHRGDDLVIEVQFSGSGTPVDLIPGTRLILNDGIFDIDRCTVEIPITTPDIYEEFNKGKDDELNFFDLLSSGPFYDINVLDYVPRFQVQYSPVDNGAGAFPLAAQAFDYYPNKRAQYPGFGTEDETVEDGYPNTAVTLFSTADLVELENNADGVPEINVGAYPYHGGYPGAPLTAVANAWRLYAFRFNIFSNSGGLGYHGDFCWIREIKDVAIGTIMTPEWVYVGVVAGMDRWARPPLLVPRTNVNRTAFHTDAFPSTAQVRFTMTSYVVGLDIANIELDTSVALATFSDGTIIPPATPIMDDAQDQDFKNYYGFFSLTNGKSLNDIIEFAVNRCDPSLTVVSDFFQINPVVVSTDNYVTTLPSFVDDIIMFQKSDVKRPFATNKATKGFFTTDKLIYWLFKMFRVKYRIDGLNFRIEHVTSDYFVRVATRDLTIDPLNRMLAGTRRYSYDKETRLPAKETFMFMEARPQGDTFPLNDFNGVPIFYDGSNVDRTADNGTFAHLVDRVTTDVHYILNHSGGIGYLIDATTKNPYPVQDAANDTTIDDDGFCLVASTLVITGGTSQRYMMIADPIIGTDRDMNNVLGWASLHNAFFRSYANTKHGTMNNAAIIFDSTKYIKKSIPLPFNLCDIGTFDPFELIITALGSGIIKNAEYDFQQEKLTVIVGYGE